MRRSTVLILSLQLEFPASWLTFKHQTNLEKTYQVQTISLILSQHEWQRKKSFKIWHLVWASARMVLQTHFVPSWPQRRMLASSPHEAKRVPLGFQAQFQTRPRWPSKVATSVIFITLMKEGEHKFKIGKTVRLLNSSGHWLCLYRYGFGPVATAVALLLWLYGNG